MKINKKNLMTHKITTADFGYIDEAPKELKELLLQVGDFVFTENRITSHSIDYCARYILREDLEDFLFGTCFEDERLELNQNQLQVIKDFYDFLQRNDIDKLYI